MSGAAKQAISGAFTRAIHIERERMVDFRRSFYQICQRNRKLKAPRNQLVYLAVDRLHRPNRSVKRIITLVSAAAISNAASSLYH
jgi:hypothetical protein